MANNATGTLQEQQDIYMESTEAHLQQLKTAGEGIYDSLADTGAINTMIDGLTKAVEVMGDFIDSTNEGFGSILTLGAMVTNLFNNQISKALNKQINNVNTNQANRQALLDMQQSVNVGSAEGSGNPDIDQAYADQTERAKELLGVLGNISQEDFTRLQNLNEQITTLDVEIAKSNEELKAIRERDSEGVFSDAATVEEIQLCNKQLEERAKLNDDEIESQQQIVNILREAKQEHEESNAAESEIVLSENERLKKIKEQEEAEKAANAELKEAEEELERLKDKREDINESIKIGKELEEKTSQREQQNSERDNAQRSFNEGNTDEDGNHQQGIEDAQRQKAISELTQSFTSLFMIMSSIKSLGSILSNDDLSGWEKFSQIASNLVFTLPMVIKSIGSFRNITDNLTVALSTAATQLETHNSLTKQKAEITQKVTKATEENTVATIADTASEEASAIAEEATTAAKEAKEAAAKGVAKASAEEIVGTEGVIVSEKADNEETGEGIILKEGLTAALKRVRDALIQVQLAGVPLWGVLLGVAAATAAVTAVVYANVKAYNAQRDAADAATESAEQVAEANDQVAESYDNLQSVIETYESAKEQLDECVKGTEEWKDALEDTTTAAVDLLNTLSELEGIDLSVLVEQFGELYDRSTGEFNEDIIDAVEDFYDQYTNASELASAEADYNAKNLTASADLLDAVRSNTTAGEMVSESESDVYRNGYSYEEMQSLIISNIDDLVNLSNEELSEELDKLGFDDQIDDINSLREAINKYSTAVDNATIALEAAADIQVSELLGDNYSDAVQELVSDQLVSQTNELTDNMVSEWKDQMNKASDEDNETYKKIIDQLNALGYEYSAADNGVRGTDNNRTFVFTDSEDEEVELTDEAVASMIAAAQALEDVEANAQNAALALGHLEDNASEGVSEGIENYISTGNFESMTQEEFSQLLSDIAGEGATASDLTADAISEYFQKTMELTEEELVDFFSDENYAENIIASAKDYDESLKSYLEGMFHSTQEAFSNLDIEKEVSTTSGKYIADALQGAFIYGTQETVDTLEDTFKDTDNLEDFIEVIQDVDDWSSITASDLIDLLDDADVSTGLSEDALRDFIDAMEETAEATQKTTAELQEAYSSIHDIIDDLSTYDTISEDDYNTLVDNGLGDIVDEYFTMMLDGTYKLTGDAEDFYELVQAQQIEQFADNIADLEDQLGLQQYVKNQMDNADENSVYNYDNLSSKANITTPEIWNGLDNWTYDADQAAAQLNALSAIGYGEEQVAAWTDALNSGNYSEVTNALEEMSDAIVANKDSLSDLDSEMEETSGNISATKLAIAESAESYDQLCQYLEEGTVDAEQFNQAYLDMWGAERTEDLDTDEIEDYADYLQDIAKETDDLSDSLDGNEEVAEDLAVQIMNMNDAVEDLSDNWEDWSSVLEDSTASAEEYYEAIEGVRSAMSKLLDVDDEFISDDFIKDNMDDIALAAEGDADAIDRLRAASYESILVQLGIDDDQLYTGMTYKLSEIQTFLDTNLLKVGAEIGEVNGSQDYIDSLNNLIDATGMTTDEVTSMLSSMGYNVEFDPETVEYTDVVPQTTTLHEVKWLDKGEDGGPQRWIETETVTTENVEVPAELTQVGTEVETGDGKSSGGSVTVSTGHVSSISKKASGSYNNYSSSNSGGSSLGSSSGSGSSDSGSSSEPDEMDYLEDEVDIYHDINLELTKISTNLSRLQSQESKFTGQKLLDNLNEQLATLNDQIDATNEKISIAQGEAADLRSELSSQGVTFDSEGYITNYASIMESQLAYVNSCIDKYNAMSADEQEAYADTLDEIKQNYEDFVQAISDYDTLISETIPGLEDDIQDAIDEQIEIEITKFTMEVEIRLDMEEAEKDWNEFYRKVILGLDDDDILGTARQDYADILSYYDTAGTGTGTIQTLTKQLNNTLEQLKQIDETGTSSVYGDNQSQALEDLQTYYTELMEQLEDVEDLVDDIEESYLDMIDEAIDAFDDHLEQYEYINDLLEHDMDIIELMYGDDAYNQLATYYQKIEDNNNAQLAFLRQRVDYAYEMMQAETDPEAQEKWMEEWEDALSELNDTVEDSLQNIIDKYTNTINEIIDELNDKVTDGLGLDYVSEEWDLINEKADIYLDEINAMYEVQDLQSKWLDAIDSTDSIAQQQKLNELMEQQLDYLEEKGELTDYDIERAELEYELALKQIQLEEAQQNSSSMRLRRDSSGNYSYEYTTDEDAIADAQSELLALQNQLYNLDVEEYNNNLNEIYDTYNDFQQKLLELYEDQTLSEEERAEQEALLMEYYGDIINSLVEENSVIRTNLQDSAFSLLANMYANDSDNFAAMTSINMESYQNMVDTFKSLNAESLTDFNNMTDQQLEWIANLTDEQLEFLTNLTDEELQKYQDMTAEELAASTALTDEQIALLTGMTSDQYTLVENLTSDEISLLQSLTEAEREQFSAMTDEQRQNFYDFATGASTDYQSMVEAMEGYLSTLDDATANTLMGSIVPGWESGVQTMADEFGEEGMEGACEEALEELSKATEDYQDDVDEMAEAAGVDLGKVADGYDEVEEQVQDVVDANDDVIDTYVKEINSIKDLMSTLDDLIKKYTSAESAAKAAATAAYEYWQSANSSAASAASNSSSSSSSSSSTSTTKSTSSSSSSSTQGDGKINVGDKVKFNSGYYYYDSYGTSPSGKQHQGEYVYITSYPGEASGRTRPIHISTGKTLGTGDLGWVAKSQISGYDTGGYTGDWNDDLDLDGKGGRLAFLHQKELVLNESDTQNLLTAVSVVSDVAGLLNNLNSSMLFNITSLLDNLGSFKFDNNNDNGIVQQNVHIEATFGDSTASEIETALNNLINSASQYANKKSI